MMDDGRQDEEETKWFNVGIKVASALVGTRGCSWVATPPVRIADSRITAVAAGRVSAEYVVKLFR